MLAKRRSLHLNQTSLSDLSAEFCFTKLSACALPPCSADLYRGRFALGLSYKFGFNLAKRQVFAEQKLEAWCVEWVLRLGLSYKFGINLAKPVVCGERKLQSFCSK